MDRFVTRTKKRPATEVAVATHNELETTDERKKTRPKDVGCTVSGDEEGYDCRSEGDFSAPLPWQKIEAEALDLDYTVLFSKAEADRLFKKLEEEIEYFSGEKAKVQVFGKFYNIPRKQATYGDPGLMYCFSGVRHLARPWTPVLEYIRDCVTKATGHTFNFVLVNRYRDGGDHIGEHRDDERELDPACPIASVSFGAARDFVFKHQDARGRRAPALRIAPVTLVLQHGSLLLMNPPTNARWYHSLPVRKRVLLPRVNLTFRRVLQDGQGRAAPSGHSGRSGLP